MDNRIGEAEKAHFRCERYYHTAEGWWFQTREHIEKGPFDSQRDAEAELLMFIREANYFNH